MSSRLPLKSGYRPIHSACLKVPHSDIARSHPGSIDISQGHPGAPSFLLARRWKEEFGQANFDADVLPEPAGRREVVKHVTCYGKILSERDLKLEMAPQEVISTDRHI